MANYYCVNCGQKFSSVQVLTSMSCTRKPFGGRHVLYEGSEKSSYTCKYCGLRFSSIMAMTNLSCSRHPDGPTRGKHSPAL